MINGLKVSFTGEELRGLLDERAARHRESAARWKRVIANDDETEDASQLPEHMCKNEAAQEEWRASVFTFLSQRIDVSEVYSLGLADLEYIEALPTEPELVGPEEYEGSADDQSDLGPQVALQKTSGDG